MTIGDNVVIGSGSVVTKDIPSGVIAVGNPCKVLRAITEEDKQYWKQMQKEYLKG
jgi:Acetyltransferase (isoleucine patch superfamily)